MKLPAVIAALAVLSFASVPAAPATAQESGSVVRVDLTGQGAGASQTLSLPRGKSAIVELPVDVRDVLVTRPDVAEAVLRSPRRIFVLGVKSGRTDAVFFDATGRRILSLDIRVDQDTAALAQTINRILPGARVRVDAMQDSVILSGEVASAADADRAIQIAKASVAKPDLQVLNMLSIAGKEQVMLKVRIVEMQRNVIKQLGFDLNALVNQVGEPQYFLGKSATFGVNGSLLGGVTGGYKLDTTRQPQVEVPCDGVNWDGKLCPIVARGSDVATPQTTAGSPGLNQAGGALKAFERVGLVRTLAEPNLTAVSGEAARFLAGGEYPVPTGSDENGRILISFKPYGVGLGFTPVVLSGGRISLNVSTEVSELTSNGAFSLAAGSSNTLTIPALTVRRAATTVEMSSGSSLMIAGLLQENTKQTLDSLPGMMNLPVLGSLFRSRDYLSGESELVVIVTPYIVNPTSPDRLQTPVDGLKIADDASTILMGRLNKTYKVRPPQGGAQAYQGPHGYVIE